MILTLGQGFSPAKIRPGDPSVVAPKNRVAQGLPLHDSLVKLN